MGNGNVTSVLSKKEIKEALANDVVYIIRRQDGENRDCWATLSVLDAFFEEASKDDIYRYGLERFFNTRHLGVILDIADNAKGSSCISGGNITLSKYNGKTIVLNHDSVVLLDDGGAEIAAIDENSRFKRVTVNDSLNVTGKATADSISSNELVVLGLFELKKNEDKCLIKRRLFVVSDDQSVIGATEGLQVKFLNGSVNADRDVYCKNIYNDGVIHQKLLKATTEEELLNPASLYQDSAVKGLEVIVENGTGKPYLFTRSISGSSDRMHLIINDGECLKYIYDGQKFVHLW